MIMKPIKNDDALEKLEKTKKKCRAASDLNRRVRKISPKTNFSGTICTGVVMEKERNGIK